MAKAAYAVNATKSAAFDYTCNSYDQNPIEFTILVMVTTTVALFTLSRPQATINKIDFMMSLVINLTVLPLAGIFVLIGTLLTSIGATLIKIGDLCKRYPIARVKAFSILVVLVLVVMGARVMVEPVQEPPTPVPLRPDFNWWNVGAALDQASYDFFNDERPGDGAR